MKQHVISILLENESGALSRVVGLFAQRGYNIEYIRVTPTEDTSLSKIIIQTNGDEKIIEQIEKQLHKLIDVLKVTKIENKNHIQTEIALIKIKNKIYKLNTIINITKTFQGKIIYIQTDYLIIQLFGKTKKLNEYVNIIQEISEIIEISRSGEISISKK